MTYETIELSSNTFKDLVNDAWNKLSESSNRIKIEKSIIGNEKASLPSEVPSVSGIYTIWVDNKLMYIGEIGKTLKLTGRLKQHLIKCHEKTQSKLALVKEASEKGSEISIAFIHVEPEPFRLALEDELIRRETELDRAPWNQKSASKGEMQNWVVERVKNFVKDFCKQLCCEDLAKGKTGITKEVLSSVFVEKFGLTADYDSIIASLLKQGKIVDLGYGYDVPKKKRVKKI